MDENNTFPSPSAPTDDCASNGSAAPEIAGWHSPTQGGITTPIAPEGGIGAYPGNDTSDTDSTGGQRLTTPTAPEGGIPAYPGSPSGAASPLFPNTPTDPCVPARPDLPARPGQQSPGFGQVRFINASTNTFPVIFSIDGTAYAVDSRFGNVSAYQWITDGFHTVSVNRSTGMQALLLQQTFPFRADHKVTMVLMDSREGGLELLQIADTCCCNIPGGYGCYRVANVSYSGSDFDIALYNGDTIFRNVGFKDITAYKQGLAGNYTFYVTNASFYQMLQELPVILIGTVTSSTAIARPLTSANVTIRAGQNTTTYIMGNTWSTYGLRMVTVDD